VNDKFQEVSKPGIMKVEQLHLGFNVGRFRWKVDARSDIKEIGDPVPTEKSAPYLAPAIEPLARNEAYYGTVPLESEFVASSGFGLNANPTKAGDVLGQSLPLVVCVDDRAPSNMKRYELEKIRRNVVAVRTSLVSLINTISSTEFPLPELFPKLHQLEKQLLETIKQLWLKEEFEEAGILAFSAQIRLEKTLLGLPFQRFELVTEVRKLCRKLETWSDDLTAEPDLI